MNKNFDSLLNTRFEKLKFNRLWIDRKYLELESMYQKEIEQIRDRYNEDRSSPVLPRNTPPVAGRILWIRQLCKRVQGPMDIFKKHDRVITHERLQKSIKMYNSLISVSLYYEMIYHKAWYNSSEVVRLALTSPLLIRHPGTNKYVVNFDPYIVESIREAEHMFRLGLTVPDFIQIITFCEDRIMSAHEKVKKLVNENDNVRKSIPHLFLNLMKPALQQLEIAFQPFLSVITWTSLEIPELCDDIEKVIKNIKIFSKEIKDIKEARIDEVFEAISDVKIIRFFDRAHSPSDFTKNNQKYGQEILAELQIKSNAAEKAVLEIINKCLELFDEPGEGRQEQNFDWLDLDKINRPVWSQAKLDKSPFEPGFSSSFFLFII